MSDKQNSVLILLPSDNVKTPLAKAEMTCYALFVAVMVAMWLLYVAYLIYTAITQMSYDDRQVAYWAKRAKMFHITQNQS